MHTRQRFELIADTGSIQSIGDTGASFGGEIKQVKWKHISGDTGGAIEILMLPVRDDDTGQGIIVLSQGLTPDFTRVPRQPACAPDGTDTGVDEYAPFVSAGERLRVKRTNSNGSASHGILYVWTADDV